MKSSVDASNRHRGAVMVEFVLIFPVILLLFFGVIQAAAVSGARSMVHYAAFRAARAAIVQEPGDRLPKAQKAAERACQTLAGYKPGPQHVRVWFEKGGSGALKTLDEVVVVVEYQLWCNMPFAGPAMAQIVNATSKRPSSVGGNHIAVQQVCRMRAQLTGSQ